MGITDVTMWKEFLNQLNYVFVLCDVFFSLYSFYHHLDLLYSLSDQGQSSKLIELVVATEYCAEINSVNISSLLCLYIDMAP